LSQPDHHFGRHPRILHHPHRDRRLHCFQKICQHDLWGELFSDQKNLKKCSLHLSIVTHTKHTKLRVPLICPRVTLVVNDFGPRFSNLARQTRLPARINGYNVTLVSSMFARNGILSASVCLCKKLHHRHTATASGTKTGHKPGLKKWSVFWTPSSVQFLTAAPKSGPFFGLVFGGAFLSGVQNVHPV
jgi:hypothetical protein